MRITMIGLSILLASVLMLIASTDAGAQHTIEGQVTFLGTLKEDHTPELGYQAEFVVRVYGKCTPWTGSPVPTTYKYDTWIHIKSGRMDGVYAHNSANFINAYNTLLTAMTSKKIVQIDGLTRCQNMVGTKPHQYLYNLNVGIH